MKTDIQEMDETLIFAVSGVPGETAKMGLDCSLSESLWESVSRSLLFDVNALFLTCLSCCFELGLMFSQVIWKAMCQLSTRNINKPWLSLCLPPASGLGALKRWDIA